MNRFICFFFCLLFSASLFGQSIFEACDYVPPKEANQWYFICNSGIDFNGSTPSPLIDNNVLNMGNSCSSICDSDGQILFFTNGVQVWNRNFELMPGGTALAGNIGCSQSAIIVQHPLHAVLYYIFTVDKIYPPNFPIESNGFCVSLVDMRKNNGLGDVVIPNKPMISETAEKVTAVRHANGRDVWVITHGWDGADADAFYSYLVNEDGVNHDDSIVSHVGIRHEGNLDSNNTVGYMKASSDGSKLALAVYGEGVIEVFNFDNNTGIVSGGRSFPPDYRFAYGVEFSPDASKLYVSTTPKILPGPSSLTSYIYQFDLDNPDPLSTETIVAFSEDSIFGALQLGTDGKIYVAYYIDILNGINHLPVIVNPNRAGNTCNVDQQGFYLAGRESRIGLPNLMQTYVDIPHFTYLHHCFGDSTAFKITNEENITTQDWDFDDPGSGNNTSTSPTPSHIFSEPGTFTVSVTENFGGSGFFNSEEVTIYPLPEPDLGADTIYLYPGASFTLDAGPGYDYYFWNFNDYSSGQTFIASDTGLYYVMVVDTNCCYNMDSVLILPSVVYLPNAFTPNGDGINDKFIAIGPTGGILNYNMFIFNRWGQLVFESDDIQNQWDGMINNEPAPPGVYVYKMTYSVELDFGKYDDILQRGHVTLLR
ncbi:MAG: gliding motility-associated C-terminal domain-containing protein [Bacteroidales bacterium]|nr:gliding motility-associated C-terminal domain-containing protein [Bacteroidales bacterium]